jgi:ligand-binding sensor domain-containing protein
MLKYLTGIESNSRFKNWYNTNYVTDIISVRDTRIIGSSKGLIIHKRSPVPEVPEFIILNKSDGLLSNGVNGLVCDDDDIFIFFDSGITILSLDTTKVRNISSSFSDIKGSSETGLLKGDTLFMGTSQRLYLWDTGGDPYNSPWNAKEFNFKDYAINVMLLHNDTLYLGTDNGLCMVPNFSFSDTTQWLWNTISNGLPNDTVTSIICRQDTLWIGTKNGVACGKMNSWILRNDGLSPSSHEINDLLLQGKIWAATENMPYFWDDYLAKWVSVVEGLYIGRIKAICSSIWNNDTTLWIGVERYGIASLDDTLWNVIRLPGPSSSKFSDIAIDKNGDVWGVHYLTRFICSRTVSHYCRQDEKWEILNSNNELGLTGPICWVDVDEHNNKWFGIWNLDAEIDILKLSENGDWDSLSLPVGGVVGSQFIDSEDNKWFSNFGSSVCKLGADDSTWHIYTNENYLSYIIAFEEDNYGNIYFGSAQRGLSVLTSDGNWLKVGGLPSKEVFDLCVDRMGNLWVGTTSGLAVVKDFEVQDEYTSYSSGLLGDNILDICIDWKNNRWFLIENRGVSVLKANGEWDSLTTAEGLASDLIMGDLDGLVFDTENGYLWIATRDGISRYETGFIPPAIDSQLQSIDVYPNPFIVDEHDILTFNRLPDDAEIYIYSISFKKIKYIGDINNVTHQAFWKGKDEADNKVDSGIYIYMVVTPDGNKKTGKIAVIK